MDTLYMIYSCKTISFYIVSHSFKKSLLSLGPLLIKNALTERSMKNSTDQGVLFCGHCHDIMGPVINQLPR